MSRKVIIGIVVKPLLRKQLTRTLWERLVINDEFRKLIVDNGAIATAIIPNRFFGNSDISNTVELLNAEDKEALYAQLQNVDGIILQGGLTSDTYEMEIVKYAIANNVPIIGICAGFNNIARTLDIPVVLKEHLQSTHDVYDKDYRHIVNVNQESELSKLFQSTTIQVNSLHTMFVDAVNMPTCTEIVAIDEAEHVEAFIVKNTKFCMAIKWHPEIMLNDISTQNIFRYFVEKCKND